MKNRFSLLACNANHRNIPKLLLLKHCENVVTSTIRVVINIEPWQMWRTQDSYHMEVGSVQSMLPTHNGRWEVLVVENKALVVIEGASGES